MTLTIHVSTMLVDDSATKVVIVGASNPEGENKITHRERAPSVYSHRLRIGERE